MYARNQSWRMSDRQWLMKVNQRFVYIFSKQLTYLVFFSSGIFTLQSKMTEKTVCNIFCAINIQFLLWVALQLSGLSGHLQFFSYRQWRRLQICEKFSSGTKTTNKQIKAHAHFHLKINIIHQYKMMTGPIIML